LRETKQCPIDVIDRQDGQLSGDQNAEILLVDDHDALRRLLAQALQRAGYLVAEAACGEEALELLPARAERLRLLITDIVMPGIDGCELARQVRLSYPHIRNLFISGYTAGLLEPGSAFLQKPFNPHQLLDSVKKILAEAPQPLTYQASYASSTRA
jgi:two-component system, cell cycle sensor histidine kinase and response regulator CckA